MLLHWLMLDYRGRMQLHDARLGSEMKEPPPHLVRKFNAVAAWGRRCKWAPYHSTCTVSPITVKASRYLLKVITPGAACVYTRQEKIFKLSITCSRVHERNPTVPTMSCFRTGVQCRGDSDSRGGSQPPESISLKV